MSGECPGPCTEEVWTGTLYRDSSPPPRETEQPDATENITFATLLAGGNEIWSSIITSYKQIQHFGDGGGARTPDGVPIYLAKFSRKLHDYEKNVVPPLNPPVVS